MRGDALRKAAVVGGFGLLGWALCAATMGFGMAFLGQQTALIVHAIAAPIFFVAISLVYFRRFAYASPLVTAAVFLAIPMAMDFFLVAMVVLRSFAMFQSALGTWIPFGLIFVATYATGTLALGARRRAIS